MRMTRFAAWFDRQSGAAFELRFFRVKSNRGEMMKLTAVLNTAILFLLSGAIVPAYPQEREEGKRPEEKQQRGQEHQRASQSQLAADHGRIPEDRFRASFGRGHTFHVNRSEFANGS